MEIESEIFENEVRHDDSAQGLYDFKLLIESALSRIYRASRSGKHFLIKTIKDNSEYRLRMLRREYEMSIGCDHPHLVHVYTYEESLPVGEGIVMEYIEGRTLEEYLAEQPSRRERERVFGQLLEAVAYLHGRGIMHNDLKLSNVLITRADNSVKLIDFGLSDSDAEFAMRCLGCTSEYASPELRRRSGKIDVRSDIYSLGVIMRRLFAGRYSRIVGRCLRENPDGRYADIEALQQAWRNRNRLWQWSLYAVIAVVFLLPWGIYLSMQEDKREHERQRDSLLQRVDQGIYLSTQEDKREHERQRDSLLQRVDQDVKQMYLATIDSIKQCEYIEIAVIYQCVMLKQMDDYRNEVMASCDEDMKATVYACVERLMQQYVDGLGKLVDAMPSFITSLKGEEEKRYISIYNRTLHRFFPDEEGL